MANSTKYCLYAVLAMLGNFAGCNLPAHRNEQKSTVMAVSSIRTPSTANTQYQDGAPTNAAAAQVSYENPSDAVPDSPQAMKGSGPSEGTAGSPELAPGPIQPREGVPEPANPFPQPNFSSDASDPFNGQAELSVEQLVAEVQARNPSLQAASAAWRAAAERYPQAVSLEDPMFSYLITPTNGLGADNGGGWMVQGSQKIPWAGKRELRGSAASAEADAMRGDIGDARLRLAEAAKTAFYDYYLARQQTDVNASTIQLLKQFREIAANKYQVGQASEQDVLQAEVESASLENRRTELARDEEVAVARINTLLHRAANHPLPPPPAKVANPELLPTAEALQQTAAGSRPDLYAAQARIRTEQANLALACKEYYPDVNVVAKYDGFMPQDMRPAVGMDVNVPIRYARRSAAVREAENRVAQRCAEYQERLDQVRYEVQSGFNRASQNGRVIRLYEEKILPASQRSLDSALANYTSGKIDFLRLLDAERQLNSQREMYYQSIAEYHRRLAELERSVGQPVGTVP